MGPRLSIVAGLAAGGLVVFALVVGIVLFGPEIVVPSPSIAASASAAPSVAGGPSPPPSAEASASPEASDGAAENFHIGDEAPALVVPQVGGGMIDLNVLEGQAVWVNFMQTTCEECLTEFPQMNAFAARYAEHGLVVIAIDVREEEGAVAAFAQSLNATFPLGLDTDGAAQRAWGAFALPVHYWVDAAGIVRDGALGGIGPDIMARGVQAILPDVEVTTE